MEMQTTELVEDLVGRLGEEGCVPLMEEAEMSDALVQLL